jgi:hypothetical protein
MEWARRQARRPDGGDRLLAHGSIPVSLIAAHYAL